MFKMKLKRKVQALVTVLVIAFTAYASATGPEAAYTSAPGDIGSCVNCHDTFVNPNVGPGTIALSGQPAIYEPGRQYTVTVTVTQAGRQKYGFQLTAIDTNGNRAGTLAPLNSETQVNFQTGTGGRQYIQHTQQGTSPTIGNGRTWQVRWTAPDSDIGAVRFFFSGNAANGDGTNQGDYIYTRVDYTQSATSNVTVALAEPLLSGQTLNAGAVQRINWNVTGASNVALIEARYSTDDGDTFPITQLAFSTQSAAATGFDWTVPNVTSSTVKLRVQVSTKTGLPVEVFSGSFAIQGDGNPPTNRPTVNRVELTGKKLRLYGFNFQEGAKVFMNGEKQKTANGEIITEQLVCKKAGNWIVPGTTVSLVVKNPDGSQSDEVLFTRPLQ